MTNHKTEVEQAEVKRIYPNSKISITAVMDLQNEYVKQFVSQPTELVTSPYSKHDLYKQEKIHMYMGTPAIETVMGMSLVVDPELKDDEWYIRGISKKIHAV